jgi:hypothetical protein
MRTGFFRESLTAALKPSRASDMEISLMGKVYKIIWVLYNSLLGQVDRESASSEVEAGRDRRNAKIVKIEITGDEKSIEEYCRCDMAHAVGDIEVV